jgi:septal ring factor EnvC (AmiA/AmiB activator)
LQRLAESPGVSERLVEIYKRGRGGYWRLLLQSQDLRAVGRMARGVASVARLDQVRFDAHRKTIRAEREALADLATRRQAVTAASADTMRARKALDQAVATQNRRIDQVDRQRDLAAQYVGELQDAQRQLQQRISGMGSGVPGSGESSSSGSNSGSTGLPMAPFRGSLEWPVSGRVTARFGRSTDRLGAALVRNGIEIGAADGEAVKAVHGGTVAFAAPFTGFGTLVIVDHGGGAFTLYGHLTDATVAQGGTVERGTVVGHAGRTPAGESALYFELRIVGRPVDPVQWL